MIEMNDVSQRAIFAIIAIALVSGGVGYATTTGVAQSPSPALAAEIPSAAAFKSELRAKNALAVNEGYGCADERRLDERRGGAARAVIDCD